MACFTRLLQSEMYLPGVNNTADLHRALGALKRYCKEQSDLALAIEPYEESDRGCFSIVVIGTDRNTVLAQGETVLNWIESRIEGQSLQTEVVWL